MANVYYQVLKHHADAIQRMYGVRWVPQPHHFKLCKQLMESEVEGFDPYTPEEIIERLQAYYAEGWWKNVRHDFANFCKHFDKFIVTKDTRTTGYKTEPKHIAGFLPQIVCRDCGQVHDPLSDCQLRKVE